MQNLFWVFLGGGLGSLLRFGIASAINGAKINFPFATFLANVVSCFLLGFLLSLSWKDQLDDASKLLLITGLCGGFSTFSTFTGETFLLFQNGHWWTAFANIIGSMAVCLISLYLGIRAGA